MDRVKVLPPHGGKERGKIKGQPPLPVGNRKADDALFFYFLFKARGKTHARHEIQPDSCFVRTVKHLKDHFGEPVVLHGRCRDNQYFLHGLTFWTKI